MRIKKCIKRVLAFALAVTLLFYDRGSVFAFTVTENEQSYTDEQYEDYLAASGNNWEHIEFQDTNPETGEPDGPVKSYDVFDGSDGLTVDFEEEDLHNDRDEYDENVVTEEKNYVLINGVEATGDLDSSDDALIYKDNSSTISDNDTSETGFGEIGGGWFEPEDPESGYVYPVDEETGSVDKEQIAEELNNENWDLKGSMLTVYSDRTIYDTFGPDGEWTDEGGEVHLPEHPYYAEIYNNGPGGLLFPENVDDPIISGYNNGTKFVTAQTAVTFGLISDENLEGAEFVELRRAVDEDPNNDEVYSKDVLIEDAKKTLDNRLCKWALFDDANQTLTLYFDDTNNKEMYLSVNFFAPEPGPGEGPLFCANYNDYGCDAKIEVGANPSESYWAHAWSNDNPYTPNEEMTFTLTPPNGYSLETALIEVQEYWLNDPEGANTTFVRSWEEDGVQPEINLSGNTFTYTPPEGLEYFQLWVWWSEYDRFGPGEDLCVVANMFGGDGHVGFLEYAEYSDEYTPSRPNIWEFYDEEGFGSGGCKVWFNRNETVELTFVAARGYEFKAIYVLPEGGEPWEVPAESYTFYKDPDHDGKSKLTFDKSLFTEWGWLYVDVEFQGTGGGGGNNQPENRFDDFDFLREQYESELFAYGEWDGVEGVDENDLIFGLCAAFAQDMIYYTDDSGNVNGGGRRQELGHLLGLNAFTHREDESRDNSTRIANIEKLASYCNAERNSSKDLTVDTVLGEKTLSAYDITMNVTQVMNDDFTELVGVDPEHPLSLMQTVYLIDADACAGKATTSMFIVRIKDKYYLRGAAFEGDSDLTNPMGGYSNDTDAVTIVSPEYTNPSDVYFFGNNVVTHDEGTSLWDSSATGYFVASINGGCSERDGYPVNLDFGGKVAIYKPSFTGILLLTDKSVVPAAWEVNTSYSVKETADNAKTDLFFGYRNVKLVPVTNEMINEFSVSSVASISVEGDIPQKAVSVTDNSDGTYNLDFYSDFYDSVKLKIVYNLSGGGTKTSYITINRVGIVITGEMTPGFNHHEITIMHGHSRNEENIIRKDDGSDFGYSIVASYYHAPEDESTSANTALFVTMTYADGSVETQIVPTKFFTAKTDRNTAISDYVLFLGEPDQAPVKVEAIAVNNPDANGRSTGAKLGAGKGVCKYIEAGK